MGYSFFTIGFVFLILFLFIRASKRKWISPSEEFPTQWQNILHSKVLFYATLSPEQKQVFEYKVHEFILNCKITGIKTEINDTDRLLVASGAIIPILAFPKWKYYNLKEVLIYPHNFNDNFETKEGENIMGMVGTGYMEDKMIISLEALHHGFDNRSDRKNTVIHEFVHLIDKADGEIDGIPELLLERQYVMPWLDLLHRKMDEIYEGSSDIHPYGATSKVEFFAVVSEYFFERPQQLKQNHPVLFKYLQKVFKQPGILASQKKQWTKTKAS